jgi:hypothetical protein
MILEVPDGFHSAAFKGGETYTAEGGHLTVPDALGSELIEMFGYREVLDKPAERKRKARDDAGG